MKLFLLFFFGIALSLMSLTYLPAPYVWISLYFFLVFLYSAIVGTKSSVKLVCLNIGFIVILLGGLETYLWISEISNDKTRFGVNYDKGYNVSNDILGYAPAKDKASTSIKYYEGKQLYNVIYTIDANGLRIPPTSNKENGKCVLFFGGSFTFGEGINDNETMPYLVGIKSNRKYRIYNFGFHGYGPHQMLSSIEHNMVNDIVKCKLKYVIYQGLVTHVDRSGGLSFWGQHGPRYILYPDGIVKYNGHFDDDRRIRKKIRNQMRKSFIYKKYFNRKESISNANVDLFVAIVDKAKRLLEEHHPEVKFHVILWDIPKKNYELIISRLNERKIKVHSIEKILPDYSINKSIYAVSPPHDNHPNALANERIADYVINHILDK